MQFYLIPRIKQDSRFPDAEVIAVAGGWSWRLLGEPMDDVGPFETQAEAIADAQAGNGIAPHERDNNARLIAAAPDLLEACEQARAALPDITFAESPEQRLVIEMLNKAITDAQGGAA